MELIQALNSIDPNVRGKIYTYIQVSKVRVVSKYKLAANAICDKDFLNYQLDGVIVLWMDINTWH